MNEQNVKIIYGTGAQSLLRQVRGFAGLMSKETKERFEKTYNRLLESVPENGEVRLYVDPYWPLSFEWTIYNQDETRRINGGLIFHRDYSEVNQGTINNIRWGLHT